jgi:hypothetical protein
VADDPLIAHTLAARDPVKLREAWRSAWDQSEERPAPHVDVEILQTHYKPFERSRIVAELTVRGRDGRPKPKRRYLFVQCYATARAASARFRAAREGKHFLRSLGPPVFEVPEWHALVWALPNGPRLRQLRSFLQMKAFRRFLARTGHPAADDPDLNRPRLLRYVPRRRALLRWEPPPAGEARACYIKLFAEQGPHDPLSNLQHMAAIPAEQLGFAVPPLVTHGGRRRVLVMEELPGRTFTSLMPDAEPDAHAAVGRALARLHACPPLGLQPRTGRATLDALGEAMQDVRRALPDLGPAIRALERDLAAGLEEARPATVHGNLFGDQILLDGERVGIVDWDDLTAGDPSYDVGRLVAHEIYVAREAGATPARAASAIDALLDGYAEEAPDGRIDGRRLRWQVTCALLMRAKISSLRTLRGDWPAVVAGTVAEARAIWEGTSHFLESRPA